LWTRGVKQIVGKLAGKLGKKFSDDKREADVFKARNSSKAHFKEVFGTNIPLWLLSRE